jgi:uncharacterized repeat protein (TIGR01451 family)
MRTLIVALVLSIGLFAWAQSAFAASIFVPTTGNPSGDGTQLALAIANAAPGDVLYLGAGTFTPAQSMDVQKNLTIIGSSAGQTTIDGGAITTASTLSGNFDILVVGNTPGSGAEPTATLRNLKLVGSQSGANALNVFGGTANVDHTLFNTNNTAIEETGTLTLTNSTVNGPAPTSIGIAADGGTTNLINDTIVGNQSGGILNSGGGAVNATNSIIAGNFPASPTAAANLGKRDCQVALTSVVASIASIATGTENKCGPASSDLRYFGGPGTCGATAPNSPSSAQVLANCVLLGPIQLNGGPMETRALLAGSPAINTGSNGPCPADDQRYFNRDSQCDVGAYEAGGLPTQGTVVVIKHVINNNTGTKKASDFTMTVNGVAPQNPPVSFPGAEAPGVPVSVAPGAYSVTESGPTGYTTTMSSDCSGTVAAGETKTCTITNTAINPNAADVSVAKVGPASVAQAGGQLSYSLTVSQVGNVGSTGVVVTDVLPAGLSFVAAGSSAGCAAVGQTVTCTVGAVAANGQVVLTVVASAGANTGTSSRSFLNQASVAAATGDDNLGNDSSNTVTTTQAGVAAATPSEQIEALLAEVQAADIRTGLKQSLSATLEHALRALDRDRPFLACIQLQVFIVKVSIAQPPQAQAWIAEAQSIQAQICGPQDSEDDDQGHEHRGHDANHGGDDNDQGGPGIHRRSGS